MPSGFPDLGDWAVAGFHEVRSGDGEVGGAYAHDAAVLLRQGEEFVAGSNVAFRAGS